MMTLQNFILIAILSVFPLSAAANEFDVVKSSVERPENYSSNLNFLEIAARAVIHTDTDGVSYTYDMTELHKVDRRKKKTKSSPAYLDAVGRIKVITNDGTNTCSGTLISTKPGQSSRTVQTAGHCFGDTKTLKKFDIKSITWETTTKSGQKIVKDLAIETLNLAADDAVVSFSGKIPFSTIKPALVLGEEVIYETFGDIRDVIVYNDNANLVVAGYSADNYKGDGGNTLTYEDNIPIRNFTHFSVGYLIYRFKGVVYSGASGGAVLIDTELSDEDIKNPYGQMFYVGTILQLEATGRHLFRESKHRETRGGEWVIYRSVEIIDTDLINKLNQ